MGMAASQARYLALVARKSNCEYEGQQINQARTALSNQSANLFNQMLGLKVPIPPSTQDFTKTQYSYTDGVNASTIDSWQQLATPEEDYNYVVTHHYYTDVYTGSQKKLSDPQVQYSKGIAVSSSQMATTLTSLSTARVEYDKIIDEYNNIVQNYEDAKKADEEAQEAYNVALQVQQEALAARDAAQKEYNTAVENTTAYYDSTYSPKRTEVQNAQTALNDKKIEAQNLDSYEASSSTWAGDKTGSLSDGKYTFGYDEFTPLGDLSESSFTGKGITYQNVQDSIDALIEIGALPAGFDRNNNVYLTMKDSTPALAFKEDLDAALISDTEIEIPKYLVLPSSDDSIAKKFEANSAQITALETEYQKQVDQFAIIEAEYNGLTTIAYEKDIALQAANALLEVANNSLQKATLDKRTTETNLSNAQADLDQAEIDYLPTIQAYENALAEYESYAIPDYIGNCELTLLENLTKDQLAEIKQITKDMAEQNIDASINKCFDENGNYKGGIYSFKMNGITYYTTYNDLFESYSSGTGNNHIDGQIKMSYYNASYISTKIEETERALLETDENGRFSSVRFENDTVTYKLNMETITDDAAYEDAMNQYYYENAKYDKMIQDINAKTSIIQQEDQQLELRLKQLDTEQNALSTEIDAVSKIVKDNIEKSFKTFGG